VKLISRCSKRQNHLRTEAQGTLTIFAIIRTLGDYGVCYIAAYCFINYRFIDALIEAGVRHRAGDDWVRVGAMMKWFVTGRFPNVLSALGSLEGRPQRYGISGMTRKSLHIRRKAPSGRMARMERAPTATSDHRTTLRVTSACSAKARRRDSRFRSNTAP